MFTKKAKNILLVMTALITSNYGSSSDREEPAGPSSVLPKLSVVPGSADFKTGQARVKVETTMPGEGGSSVIKTEYAIGDLRTTCQGTSSIKTTRTAPPNAPEGQSSYSYDVQQMEITPVNGNVFLNGVLAGSVSGEIINTTSNRKVVTSNEFNQLFMKDKNNRWGPIS